MGFIGQHELEIDDRGLMERTEEGETRHFWFGIEKIVETDRYAFVFVSPIQGHVIPKMAIIEGDVKAFMARANQFWRSAKDAQSHEQVG